MQVSTEEILHIAKLANLKLKEEQVEEYRNRLEEILNFVTVINHASIEGITQTIGGNPSQNVFRKDEIQEFQDREALLQNAPQQQMGMFKIPKVREIKVEN